MEKKITKILLVVIVILLVTIGFSGYTYYRLKIIGNISFDTIDKTNENLGIIEQPQKPKNPSVVPNPNDTIDKIEPIVKEENDLIRLVLLGIDSRSKNDRGRSDAIMVLTIDTENKIIKMGSFLRDLQVEINGKSDKINHAYSYDGGVGTLRALNSNFDLDLKNYVTVNMFNLRKVIDKIGKVSVEIKGNEIKEINYRIKEAADLEGWNGYTLIDSTGIQEINGEQAVAYMRIRNTGSGDIARTGRQREVLSLLLGEVSKKNILEVMSIASESAKLVGTTLEVKEIESIVLSILPILKGIEVEGKVYPYDNLAYSDMSTGVYYMKIRDKDIFTTDVKDFLGY